MGYSKRLEKAFANAPVLPLNQNSRYVLFSDCHRGIGTTNDNFLKNQHLYYAALQYYFYQGFTYLELGDGDELWENRSLEQIVEAHSYSYLMLSHFYKHGRLHMIYGNHDMVKKDANYAARAYDSCFHLESQCQTTLFPDLQIREGYILNDCKHGPVVYLAHGHQADLWNSTFWRLSRSLVRYLWGPLERLGVLDPTSAAKNYKVKKRTEERLLAWAKHHQRLLICGHTHRPVMGTADSPYCNTGSCVHPYCITCLEIRRRQLTLVKWAMAVRPDEALYVEREELTEPVCIEELIQG